MPIIVRALEHSFVSAHYQTQFAFENAIGGRLRLAVLNERGGIVSMGVVLETASWGVVSESYGNFWDGFGFLKVQTAPTAAQTPGCDRDPSLRRTTGRAGQPSEHSSRGHRIASRGEPIPLDGSVVGAKAHTGFVVTTADGRFAQLALVDEGLRVVDSGESVAIACWNAAISALEAYWESAGWLVVRHYPSDGVTVQDLCLAGGAA